MIKLDKLLAAQKPADMVSISLAEFLKVSPHSFTKSKVDSLGVEHTLDVEICSVNSENGALVLQANCLHNGSSVQVDNPLLFVGVTMMVSDGTFEVVNDPSTGVNVSVPNLYENAEAAMQEYVLYALKTTVLKGTVWER